MNWDYRVDADVAFMSVVGGVIYLSSFTYSGRGPSFVTALDASTGVSIWQFQGSNWPMTAIVAGQTVYIGSYDGSVTALRASGGDVLWTFEVPWSNDVERRKFGALAAGDGIVYAASDEGEVYALEAATGHLLWRYEAGGRISTPPVLAQGMLYIGSQRDHNRQYGYLHALEAASGEIAWRSGVGRGHFQFDVDADGTVYLSSEEGIVSAINGSDGEAFWHYEFGGIHPLSPSVSSHRTATFPIVVDGVVYVGSEDGSVYALVVPNVNTPAASP